MLSWYENLFVIVVGSLLSLIITVAITWPFLSDVWLRELAHLVVIE